MPGAYYKIASTRLTGNQGTITLGSIPNTYKHLELRVQARGQSGEPAGIGSLVFYFNNTSSGNVYPRHNLSSWNNNIVPQFLDNSDNMTLLFYMRGGGSAYYSGIGIFQILDYTTTSKYKVMRGYGGIAGDFASGAQNESRQGIGFGWLENSASTVISSITMTPDQSGFGAGTVISLYGIKDS